MKQAEIIKLTDTEIQEEIEKKSGALADLKMAHAVSPLENPSQLKTIRKSIARLNTELTKRQGKK